MAGLFTPNVEMISLYFYRVFNEKGPLPEQQGLMHVAPSACRACVFAWWCDWCAGPKPAPSTLNVEEVEEEL